MLMSANIQCTDLYLVSFKAKKINGAPMKPYKLCFKDTRNFATLLFFLAACNKKFQGANATEIV